VWLSRPVSSAFSNAVKKVLFADAHLHILFVIFIFKNIDFSYLSLA